MYSLNVPIPGSVGALAGDLARRLHNARQRPRGERTLVVKRLGAGPYGELEARTREAISGTAPFAARIDAVDVFTDPPTGTGPVVYLAVESPALRALHERLCAAFDPVDGIEGDGYVPHVTVARGGDPDAAHAIAGPVDPLEWTVDALALYDAERRTFASRVSLPA
ncbi:MAG: 2'-5' RNA ligase family protein [Haloarculaceae archaeon]